MSEEHRERRVPQNSGDEMEQDVPTASVQPEQEQGVDPRLIFPDVPLFDFEPVVKVEYYGFHEFETDRRHVRRRLAAEEGEPADHDGGAQRELRLSGRAPAEPEAMSGLELECAEALAPGARDMHMAGAAEATQKGGGPRGQTSGEVPRNIKMEERSGSESNFEFEPVGGRAQ